jgi:hypothetical protein
MSFKRYLITELCKRACKIYTTNSSLVSHLPKCLTGNNFTTPNIFPLNIDFIDFKVTSVISEPIGVYFYKNYLDAPETEPYYTATIYKIVKTPIDNQPNSWLVNTTPYEFCFYAGNENNESQLDFLVYYLYTNDKFKTFDDYHIDKNFPTSNQLILYRSHLKITMINDLVKNHILIKMRVIDMFLQISDLKNLFIQLFIRLDNWHNVCL